LLKRDREDKSKNDIDELIIAFYDICTNKAIYKQKSSTDSEIVVLLFFVTLKILAKEGQLAICQLLTLPNLLYFIKYSSRKLFYNYPY